MNAKTSAYLFVTLIASSAILPILAAPSNIEDEGRKYNVKPNNKHKVFHKQHTTTNSIEEPPATGATSGFSWGSFLNTMLHMLFSSANIEKQDNAGAVLPPGGTFNWSNVLNIALRVLLAAFSGASNGSGQGPFEKIGTEVSPIQGILTAVISGLMGTEDGAASTYAKQAGEFINLVVNLLDALKTSFSQRSLHARSLGSKDSYADAALAAIDVGKGYVRTFGHKDEGCYQRELCNANRECSSDVSESGIIFCQFATYGTSYLLERSTSTPLDLYNDAGRRGRAGEDCQAIYKHCNEV